MKGNIRILLALTFFLSSVVIVVFAQFPAWDVPAKVNEQTCPVEIDKKALEAGKAVYNLNCKACHGETGLGDGVIPSGDFTAKALLINQMEPYFIRSCKAGGRCQVLRPCLKMISGSR